MIRALFDTSDESQPEVAGRGPAGEAGMTLVEVLIALVILAVGLLAIAGMSGAVAMQTRMGGSVTGQTVAGQEVLESLQMKGYDDPALDLGSHSSRTVRVNSYTYTVGYSVTQEATDLKKVTAVIEKTRELPTDTMRTLVASMDTVEASIP